MVNRPATPERESIHQSPITIHFHPTGFHLEKLAPLR